MPPTTNPLPLVAARLIPSNLCSWALRTAVGASLLSWGLWTIPERITYFNSSTSFFAVFAFCVCSMETLGSSLDSSVWVASGSLLGGCLGAIVIACSSPVSGTAVWVSVAVLSPLILLIPLPDLFTKLCLAVFLSTILRPSASAIIDEAIPVNYVLGAGVGVSGALLLALFFAVRANAQVKAHRISATRSFSRAVIAATAALVAKPVKRAALVSSVSTLLAKGMDARAASLAAAVEAKWEHVKCAKRHPPRPLGELLLATQAVQLAMVAAAEGDDRLATLHAAAKAAVARAKGGEVGGALRTELAATEAAQKMTTELDATLAPVAAPLAAAVSDLLVSCFEPRAGCCDSLWGQSPLTGAAAATVEEASLRVVTALQALDAAFLEARSTLTHSSTNIGQEHVPSQVAIAMHGVPPGRYLFVWALKAYAKAALDQGSAVLASASSGATPASVRAPSVGGKLVEAADVAASDAAAKLEAKQVAVNRKDAELSAIGSPVPVRAARAWWFALLPTPPRLLYAARLTLSILVTMAFARWLLGNAVWAATTIAFIGPRDGMTAGGTMHAGFLRVVGTIAGSLVGAAVATAYEYNPSKTDMYCELGAWVFLTGFVRKSPRHSYAAGVAQFTPFLFLGASVNATDTEISRISQTLLGVLIFAIFEMLVLPVRVEAAQRAELGASLTSAGVAVRAVMTEGNEAVSHAAAALSAANARQAMLLQEAGDEPSWLPIVVRPPLPDAASRAALAECKRAALLLDMVAALGASVRLGFGETPLMQPVTPALRNLLNSLGDRYDKMAEMARGEDGDWLTSVALAGASYDVVAALNSIFLDLHDSDLVSLPNSDLIGFVCIAWASRALVDNARGLGSAVRALGGRGREAGVEEVEKEEAGV